MYDIRVEEFPARKVGVMPHRGAFQDVGVAFEAMYPIIMASDAVDWASGAIAIYYSDPRVTPNDELESAAAVVLKDGMEIEALETRDLAGGKYALVEVVGPYEGLPKVWDWLYASGIEEAKLLPRNEPPLELYLNDPNETPPEELRTVIAIPVS